MLLLWVLLLCCCVCTLHAALCSGTEVQPPSFEGSDTLTLETATLFREINEARVHKTPGEIVLMKYVNHLGSRAHVAMMQVRGHTATTCWQLDVCCLFGLPACFCPVVYVLLRSHAPFVDLHADAVTVKFEQRCCMSGLAACRAASQA